MNGGRSIVVMALATSAWMAGAPTRQHDPLVVKTSDLGFSFANIGAKRTGVADDLWRTRHQHVSH